MIIVLKSLGLRRPIPIECGSQENTQFLGPLAWHM